MWTFYSILHVKYQVEERISNLSKREAASILDL